MAITVEARTELIALVVGMFGAAPGANVLSDLVAAKEAGSSVKQIAANLANHPEFKNIYPTFQTNAEFASKFLDNLLGTTVGATDLAAAKVEVTGMLNAGASRSSVVVDVLAALDALPTTHPIFGAAAASFDNKVAVATYYSVDKVQSGASLAALQDVIDAVDSTAASVTAAKAVIDGGSIAGGTFTLTTSATDVIIGTSNDDVIIGDFATNGTAGTVQASDFIDGGTGNDTLQIFNFGQGANNVLPVIVKNVETINFIAANTNDPINTAAMTGLTSVKLQQADAYGGTVTTGSGQSLELNTAVATAAAITWAASATGSSASLTLSGFKDAGNGLVVTGASSKTLNIASTTASNTVTLTSATATKLVVTGDKSLDLSGAALSASVATVDASANTGGLKATIGVAASTITGSAGADTIDATAGTGKTTVSLGAGNDTLKLGNIALNVDSSYAGGDGTDTVQITDGANVTVAAGKQITGFETLSTGAGTGTYNVEALAGITTVNVDGALAGAVVIDKVTTQAVNITVSTGAQNVTVALKDATGSADKLTVGIGGAASVTAQSVIVDAVETVTINSTTTGVGSNTITKLNIDDATTLNITGTAKLTAGFTNADTLTKIDASANTKGFVMTEATLAVVGGTYIGGAGADTFIGNDAGDAFYGAGGGDTITLGAGGAADTIVVKAAADSKIGLTSVGALSTTGMDTITNFVSGEDSLDLGAFGFTGNAQSGLINKGVIVAATSLLSLATTSSVDFFNDGIADRGVAIATTAGGDSYVFIDANKDGDFTAGSDIVILLSGTAAVALNDIGF